MSAQECYSYSFDAERYVRSKTEKQNVGPHQYNKRALAFKELYRNDYDYDLFERQIPKCNKQAQKHQKMSPQPQIKAQNMIKEQRLLKKQKRLIQLKTEVQELEKKVAELRKEQKELRKDIQGQKDQKLKAAYAVDYIQTTSEFNDQKQKLNDKLQKMKQIKQQLKNL